MRVFYGYDDNLTDITSIVLEKCMTGTAIHIPDDDVIRARIFGDPYPGILKNIVIEYLGERYIFDDTETIDISVPPTVKQLTTRNTGITPRMWYESTGKFIENPKERLDQLHKYIKLKYGHKTDEYPEQLMAIRYVKEDSKVLEIGGNIGRNTVVIGTILKDPKNLVTLECDSRIGDQLKENLKLNSCESHVEKSVLSLCPLIQQGWNTMPLVGDVVPSGWKQISTISFADLIKKYQIDFDTLVADCEGALFYIFKDDTSLLDNIKTVIMENDYMDITHKQFVDKTLTEKGFKRVYSEAGGWGPCYDNFFEVWAKSE